MPFDHSLGSKDQQRRPPPAPQARKPNPEEAISEAQPETLPVRSIQNGKTVPEGEDLGMQSQPTSEATANSREQRKELGAHRFRRLASNAGRFKPDQIFGRQRLGELAA